MTVLFLVLKWVALGAATVATVLLLASTWESSPRS